MEIERKFEMTGFPDLTESVRLDMYQGYLCTSPVELRIRKSVDHAAGTARYRLCIKSIGDLVRHEIEQDLSAEHYEELESMLVRKPIHKEFRAYRLADGHTLECSAVDDTFYYAEVEFDSVEEAEAWQPLDCLGRETTYEKGRRMRIYWDETKDMEEYQWK